MRRTICVFVRILLGYSSNNDQLNVWSRLGMTKLWKFEIYFNKNSIYFYAELKYPLMLFLEIDR